ncbi:MAG: DUF1997 domain-containing protein [Thermomicrobiales bacterium]
MMTERAGDMPLQTGQHAVFALPCSVASGIAYLNPTIVLNALPGVERVIQRQRGAYRVTFAPIHVPGISLRPAAEITFATTNSQVAIRSIAEAPHDLQAGEVATRVIGLFVLMATATGCDVHASLRVAASVPARILPALMPRSIAQRAAETVLSQRIKQEVQMMTRALVQGYAAWERSEHAVRDSE